MKIKLTKSFWIGLTAIIAVFTLYVMIRTVAHIARTRSRMADVRVERDRLQRSIESDSLFIENLSSEEFLETYAREQFNLQRPGETVYIVE